jgi:hypothetical protein
MNNIGKEQWRFLVFGMVQAWVAHFVTPLKCRLRCVFYVQLRLNPSPWLLCTPDIETFLGW